MRLEVVISGGPRQVLTAHNRRGWSAFALDTSKLAGKRADVTFTISTTRAGGRHYCFAAEIAK